MDVEGLRLSPNQLHRSAQADQFSFSDTSEILPKQAIIGQERGTSAIEFGINIQSDNFNLFVLGPAGSGRVTAVQHFINEHVADDPTPDDWCYVHNFDTPHQPRAIRLPTGQGPIFKRDIEKLITALQTELKVIFAGETFTHAHQQLLAEIEDQSNTLMAPVEQLATEKSFTLQQSPEGAIIILPVQDDKPLTAEAFNALSEEEKQVLMENRREVESALERAFLQSREMQNKWDEALDDLQRNTASAVLDKHIGAILQKYDLSGAVIEYFDALRNDVLDSLEEFITFGTPSADEENPMAQLTQHQLSPDHSNRYKVNVLVTNKPLSGAPVVVLDLPTYQNLIGRIEHITQFGMLTTDFTRIRCGALHQANGGFLIIRALDILQQPHAWEALKRAISRKQIAIEDPDIRNPTVNTTEQLDPEPIALNLKVVLVGSAELYYLLYNEDDRFPELFRVKADFVNSMKRTPANEQAYAQFIATLCHEENLLHFEVDAVREVIDYGSWLVSDQEKLSTQFGTLAPLIYESIYFAQKNGHKTVLSNDVKQAIAASTYRNNQMEILSQEQITDGTIFIDVAGEEVGQVNSLVVIQQGEHAFGLPSRITARVFMGRKDVVQIDRESRLTGPIHDKGVLILQGYLGGKYAQDYPLTLSATLTFEQSYGGVEGDSASSTELYALLSALSGFPIRQDIAVTGSVNQLGRIQPIGGATQKIEGFYAICKANNLTGTQGVIIPRANVRHLMLNTEVVQAVRDGKFHVYAVETIDEGMSILTGKSPEAIHQAVDTRLRHLAESLVAFEEHHRRH